MAFSFTIVGSSGTASDALLAINDGIETINTALEILKKADPNSSEVRVLISAPEGTLLADIAKHLGPQAQSADTDLDILLSQLAVLGVEPLGRFFKLDVGGPFKTQLKASLPRLLADAPQLSKRVNTTTCSHTTSIGEPKHQKTLDEALNRFLWIYILEKKELVSPSQLKQCTGAFSRFVNRRYLESFARKGPPISSETLLDLIDLALSSTTAFMEDYQSALKHVRQDKKWDELKASDQQELLLAQLSKKDLNAP